MEKRLGSAEAMALVGDDGDERGSCGREVELVGAMAR